MRIALIGAMVLILSLVGQPYAFGEPGEEKAATRRAETVDDHHLASLLTIVNVPVRGVVCGLTSVMASIFMAASGGTRYADAAEMVRDGCAGPWVITPLELAEERPGRQAPMAYSAHAPVAARQPVHDLGSMDRGSTGAATLGVEAAPAAERFRGGGIVVDQTITVGGRATRIEEAERVIFPEIAFKFDSAELTDLGKGQAYLVAQKLKAKEDLIVLLEGHADDVGTDAYNQKLGLRRAESVIKELTELGVDPARMSTASLGESKPLVDLETDWARAVNRRVELRILAP
jgi:outer membrane protein OmpA-like peptidoglycan-associated protein